MKTLHTIICTSSRTAQILLNVRCWSHNLPACWLSLRTIWLLIDRQVSVHFSMLAYLYSCSLHAYIFRTGILLTALFHAGMFRRDHLYRPIPYRLSPSLSLVYRQFLYRSYSYWHFQRTRHFVMHEQELVYSIFCFHFIINVFLFLCDVLILIVHCQF